MTSKSKNIFFAFVVLGCFVCSGYAQRSGITVYVESDGKPISSELFGVFFEDINYAADGGLYAELIQNRSFEYSPADSSGWGPLTAWELVQRGGGEGVLQYYRAQPLHPHNPTYAMLGVRTEGQPVGLRNTGFGGIPLKGGERYDFSLFARQLSNNNGPLTIRLETRDGQVLDETELPELTGGWEKYTAVLTPSRDYNNGWLVISARHPGCIALDMVSLFPQKTFKNRKNGLRRDLAQTIAELEPEFVRFPGGCLVHGHGIDNFYNWKNTIGPLEQRKGQRNVWGYHQSMGLGYFEYFQFCEDIGAEPLPVVPAAVSCQNSGAGITGMWGQGQQAVPMEDMQGYIQDVLDLIEWANGPADSEWGAKRAQAGHPEPFELKYLGVGNEDVISEAFRKRFKMIHDAVKEKYPEITVIGTTGPAPSGRDYEAGWEFAGELNLEMVDEHGYESPIWFWQNLKRFDEYERSGTKVYLGEYAAHDTGRANTLRSALAEAAYMTSIERNGDIVSMTSYAPLLAKQDRTQWRPDLIYFDNTSITPSINYYVQKLFSRNSGNLYLPTTVEKQKKRQAEESSAKVSNGVLLGTWNTRARFDDVKVRDSDGVILKELFDSRAKGWDILSGKWDVSGGAFSQLSGDTPALSMYSFETDQPDYTVTLRAMKTGGEEGFLIGFGAVDRENYYWLNLGGWGNTAHQIEKTMEGSRSGVGASVPGEIEANRWYDIKIQVSGERIKCYLDGELIINTTDKGFPETPDLAVSTVKDSQSGDIIIKLVSKSDTSIPAEIDLTDLGEFQSKAVCTVLSGNPRAVNRFRRKPQVLPQEKKIEVSKIFDYNIPPHSLSVIRIKNLK